MTRFRLPSGNRKPNLTAMRRNLITAMWVDYQLFGYVTESVKALQQQIVKEKQRQAKVVEFPEQRERKAA